MLVEIRDRQGALLQEPFAAEYMAKPCGTFAFAGRKFRRTSATASRVWRRDEDGVRHRVLLVEAVEILPPPRWQTNKAEPRQVPLAA